MRRRGSEFRRPVRRRFSNVFWLTLCGLLILLLIVLLSRDNNQPTSRSVYTKVNVVLSIQACIVLRGLCLKGGEGRGVILVLDQFLIRFSWII